MLQMIQEMDLDIVDFRVEEKENDRIEVFTKHVVDEYEAELNLFDESSGTQKLFGLLPFIAKSLLRGTTLVIDELDAKIHPVLLKYLIMTFSNMEKNKKGAQLIFTSHDLSTMNSEVFRRDEIWFVAKGNRQNSKLYSLVEFKLETGRKNQIRVHTADMGHPVCGDIKYGNGDDPCHRLCLHAYVLCFYHPVTHQPMEFETPIPPEFRRALKS